MQEVCAVRGTPLDALRGDAYERITRSTDNKSVATGDARQVHFQQFITTYKVDIFDPSIDLDDLFACYTVTLLNGDTIKQKKIKVTTMRGYLKAATQWMCNNGIDYQFSMQSDSNAAKLLKAQKSYETLPARRLPLTPAMVFEAVSVISEGSDNLSKLAAFSNWVAVGRHTGNRAQEFAQEKEDTVQYYVLPDGTQVPRSLTRDYIVFLDKDNNPIELGVDDSLIVAVELRYEIQKNRDNNQKISYSRNKEHPKYCIVENMMKICYRAAQLGQPNHLPVNVYRDDDGITKYMTSDDVTELIRIIAKKVMPDITDEELSLYSCHSIRVTACVLLHEAGKDGTYIKLRLRWNSECFQIYLRNTATIRAQHTEALRLADDILAEMELNH